MSGYMCLRKRHLNGAELKELLEGTECKEKGRIKIYNGDKNYCYFLKKPVLSQNDLKYIGKAGLTIMIGANEEEEIFKKMQNLEKKPKLDVVGTKT